MSSYRQKSIERNKQIDILLNKSKEELVRIILENEEHTIPVSIINSELHPLQAIVKYLHEEENFTIKHISLILNRNIQTIWTSYRLVKDKKLTYKKNGTKIPLSILSKNNNSILESIVHYLKSIHEMPLSVIAKTLGKSIKTVWTCNHRFIIKGGKK